jgi:hypothetical protein
VLHQDKLDTGLSKMGLLHPRYENLKPNSRLQVFTSESPATGGSLYMNRPASTQPKDKAGYSSSVNKRVKEDGDENDSRSSNVYQRALKTFLGKETSLKAPQSAGLPNSHQSKAVKPKRNLLDDKNDELLLKAKRTLLLNEEKRGDPIPKSVVGNAAVAGSYRRPSSAPLKDKDKLNNPKKTGPPRPLEHDSYGSRFTPHREDSMASTKKEVPEGRATPVLSRTRELPPGLGAPLSTNSIYKGPVIKKKVLN